MIDLSGWHVAHIPRDHNEGSAPRLDSVDFSEVLLTNHPTLNRAPREHRRFSTMIKVVFARQSIDREKLLTFKFQQFESNKGHGSQSVRSVQNRPIFVEITI